MKSWADKHVLVLGLGETGLSMLRWLGAQGARLRAADSRAEPPCMEIVHSELPQAEVHCGAFEAALLDGIDLIAISPGVPLTTPLVQQAIARGIPAVGDIELFAQQLATSDYQLATKVIAITGSNGKTTVTALIEHLCKAVGKDAVAAGNISPAVLDVVMQRGDKQPEIWVLELSSFQLETTSSLNADAATVLNVSEDHLDRYTDMDDYAAAKARIFEGNGVRLRHVTAKQPIAGAAALHPLPHQTLARTVSGVQVLNRDDARSMGMALPGRKVVTFGLNQPPQATGGWDGVEHDLNETKGDFGIERHAGALWLVQGSERLLRTDELQLSGLHNVANALAALALCRAIGLPMHKLLGALRSFKGLPHRVERIVEIDGVSYYDDSKGTNVGATVAAIQGLGNMGAPTSGRHADGDVGGSMSSRRRIVLIAGGEGKGQDFAPLLPAVSRHARAVLLIGRDAPLIEAALQGCGVPLLRAASMEDAVDEAARLAQPGDAVLLSPACASFDMFRNYAHRAEAFIAAVHALRKVTV